MLLKLSN